MLAASTEFTSVFTVLYHLNCVPMHVAAVNCFSVIIMRQKQECSTMSILGVIHGLFYEHDKSTKSAKLL